MPPRMLDTWKLSAAYFVVVGLLLGSAAVISMQPRHAIGARLVAPQTDSIGIADVVSSVHSGYLGHAGVAALMLVGPGAEMFRASSFLWLTSGFLLLTAAALFRRVRMGAIAGSVWALFMLGLSGIAATQISSSYSFAARLFMFGPAVVFNLVLLAVLCHRLTPLSIMKTS